MAVRAFYLKFGDLTYSPYMRVTISFVASWDNACIVASDETKDGPKMLAAKPKKSRMCVS